MIGGLHRVIALAAHPGGVRAALEDDFHHFRVTLRHDGARVTGVDYESPRHPFSLCPGAGARLAELIGLELAAGLTPVFARTDARQQCTHQFDLAALAVATAARGASRRYHAWVPDGVAGRTEPQLWRDGERVLRWSVESERVVSAGPCAGISLRQGFTDWAAGALPSEEREAAIVLRRAVMISHGRRIVARLDALPHAWPAGGCWVMQPERHREAARCVGSARDFSERASALLAEEGAWLDGPP
jgi:hypothetical protein